MNYQDFKAAEDLRREYRRNELNAIAARESNNGYILGFLCGIAPLWFSKSEDYKLWSKEMNWVKRRG